MMTCCFLFFHSRAHVFFERIPGMRGSGWCFSRNEDEDQAPCIYLYFFVVLQIATRLSRRQHVCYTMYPWCLCQLADPRVSASEKEQITQKFLNAADCCLDEGCSLRLRRLPTCTRDLQRIAETISFQKPLNAEIEDNFARHHTAATVTRGALVFVCFCVVLLPSDFDTFSSRLTIDDLFLSVNISISARARISFVFFKVFFCDTLRVCYVTCGFQADWLSLF